MRAPAQVSAAILLGSVVAACSPSELGAERHGAALALPDNPSEAARRAAEISARQAAAPATYDIRPTGSPGTFESFSPAQGIRSHFRSDRIELTSSGIDGADRFAFRLLAVGHAGVMAPVAAVAPHSFGNRVRYLHPEGLEHWYSNGPLGIEQGFTFQQPPPGPTGELRVELAVEGELSVTLGDDDRVHLQRADGTPTFNIGEMVAFDATGRLLPAALEPSQDGLRLRVDDSEAVYPLRIDPLIWLDQKALSGDDDGTSPWTLFGSAVALDSETVVVGAYLEDVSGVADAGTAYIFSRDADVIWSRTQKLPNPTPMADDNFGFTVAVSGDTAVVGEGNWTGIGSVHVYVRGADESWSEQALLTGSDTSPGDWFGDAVVLEGDTAMVAAAGFGAGSGAVYVFARGPDDSWSQQAKLVPAVPAPNLSFGWSLALDGDNLLVGAGGDPGRGYVFVRGADDSWSEQAQLIPTGVAANAGVGWSVALDADSAAISAPDDDGGSVLVFTRDSNDVWTEQQKLKAPDVPPCSQSPDGCIAFGRATALSGDWLLVGAPSAGAVSGAAYVYQRDGSGTWSWSDTLAPAVMGPLMEFGIALAMEGSTAVVGSGLASSAVVYRLAAQVGDSCESNADCHSGYCADDVCCQGDCDAPCEVCSLAAGSSKDGSCMAAPAGTACEGYVCDGVATSCPSSCVDDAECAPPAHCNTHGNCVAPCGSDASCEEVEFCGSDGACHNKLPIGETCEGDAQCSSGPCLDGICCTAACAPYHCRADGVCREACDTTAHCLSQFECNADRQCVPVQPPVVISQGCLCRAPAGAGTASFSGRWSLLLLGLLLGLRRRDQAARRSERVA